MKETTSFEEKPRITHPFRFNPVFMTMTMNIMNNRVIVQEFDNIPGQSANHRYEYDMLDDETCLIEGDYHRTTKNMLVGIAQRLRQLQHHGQEREP